MDVPQFSPCVTPASRFDNPAAFVNGVVAGVGIGLQDTDEVLEVPRRMFIGSLPQAVRHLKKTMHLTTAELAKLSGISFRTLQDIESEKSEGTVQTMNRVFGVLGLKLGVVRVSHDDEFRAASVSVSADKA